MNISTMISAQECTTMRWRLLKAAENDDICELNILLTLNKNLLHDCAPMWEENPLHIACKHGSLEFLKTIIGLKPGFARETSNHGFTPMHLASANGYAAMVIVLAELDPQLCLMVDRDSKIPLHRAVMKGKEDVVRALINACPESLGKVTYHEETALHLALKYNQCGTFKVLMEELKKHKQEDLLDKKDHKGNTVLHIATSQKLIEILELLLSKNVQVNSVNNRGFTAFDVHYQTSYDMVALEISHILHDAGAVEGQFSSDSHLRQQSSLHCPNDQNPSLHLNPASVILTVLILIVEVGFVILTGYANSSTSQIGLRRGAKFDIEDLILGPHRLPYGFYLMMFITVGFIMTISVLVALVWRYSPYRTVILFALVTMVVIPYVLIVDHAIPPFSVSLASFDIQSSLFMWLSAVVLVIFGVTIWGIKKALCCFYNWRKAVI